MTPPFASTDSSVERRPGGVQGRDDVGSYWAMGTEEAPEPAQEKRLDPLLQLQELDLSIDRLNARLGTLESQNELRAGRTAQAEVEARLGEIQLSVNEVGAEQRRLEGDVDSMQRKIDAEQARLYDGSVANIKELQSIEAEVASLKGRKSRTEDRMLELMERREELEEQLRPLEGEAKLARERVAEIEEGAAKELVDIERALGERAAERAALVPQFDPELLRLYDEIRVQKRGIGAAALVDGVCQGCHQKLSPVYLDRLKRTGDIRRCEYCRRILVLP